MRAGGAASPPEDAAAHERQSRFNDLVSRLYCTKAAPHLFGRAVRAYRDDLDRLERLVERLEELRDPATVNRTLAEEYPEGPCGAGGGEAAR